MAEATARADSMLAGDRMVTFETEMPVGCPSTRKKNEAGATYEPEPIQMLDVFTSWVATVGGARCPAARIDCSAIRA